MDIDISIHAPTRGATAPCGTGFQNSRYFNPRSHEGSDAPTSDKAAMKIISIHAPTRGATSLAISKGLFLIFQSTLPRGERQCAERVESTSVRISIHAPTRGATKDVHTDAEIQRFQSTLPRGERRWYWLFVPLFWNFNPRSHEGSDCNID